MKRSICFIIAMMLAMSFSSCAKKRYLVIDDEDTDLDSLTSADESVYNTESEVNETYESTGDTVPETMPSINGVDRGESLVFELSINKNYYIVVDYNGTADAVEIPATYLGKPVREIGERAFENSVIKSVTIPDGITQIRESAFFYCTRLETLTIPDSVMQISKAAFAQCHSLRSVELGDGVKFIGAFAFLHCRNLLNIELPSGIEYIHDDVFQGTAYYNDPANWTNDVLYIGEYLIEAKPGIQGTYAVKEGTTLIAANAFYNQTELTRVDIPNSVYTVCGSAFAHCTALETVTFGNAIITEKAFNGSDNIKTVYYIGTVYDMATKKEMISKDRTSPLLDAEWRYA